MKTLEIMLHEDRNVRMTVLLQEVGGEFAPVEKRPAVIVLPGGGYSMCSDREADPVALAFAMEGYQAFILRYTVQSKASPLWPRPIEDYDEAYELIRDRAEEWAVDMSRIATCGFSAGGHLAACTATVARHRPAAAILGYPAILPDIVDACAPGLPYPHEHVDDKTPPCFIFTARDDMLVSVKNSTAFADALTDKGVSFELHVYSYGGHGYSTGHKYINSGSLSARTRNWVGDALGFLSEVWGEFGAKGFTHPQIQRTVVGDFDDFLSVNCTVAHLEKQSDAAGIIGKELESVNDALAARGYEGASAQHLKAVFKLKTLLDMIGVPMEQIYELDAALGKVQAKRE